LLPNTNKNIEIIEINNKIFQKLENNNVKENECKIELVKKCSKAIEITIKLLKDNINYCNKTILIILMDKIIKKGFIYNNEFEIISTKPNEEYVKIIKNTNVNIIMKEKIKENGMIKYEEEGNLYKKENNLINKKIIKYIENFEKILIFT
jgi:hypothetical protein